MMTRLSFCHHITPTCKAHRRGSVMLLTVVSLLMLAIIGMAYLQTSRLDRATASTSAKTYIDVVANASIAYIGQVLRNDLITSDGAMLDRSSGIEAYDYPWTSDNASYSVQYNDGSTATAKGGKLDDTWLASTEPDLASYDKATWPHITNLNGTFLRIPSRNSNYATPVELAVDNSINTNKWRRDTAVPINVSSNNTNLNYVESGFEKLGADADGDGIEDSKWTWAPIRQVSGVSYVMAARIVDNSALLNMNVSLSQVDASYNYPSQPQWLSPSELDFGTFAYDLGASDSEIKAILKHRLDADSVVPLTLPIDSSTLYNFWIDGAMLYDNYTYPYQKLSILNEMELRYRNGLNNSKITAPIEASSTGMVNFLRANASNESSYRNVQSTMTAFFDNEPRHQLTTINGVSIIRAALPNELAGTYKRSDLSLLLTDDHAASYELSRKLYDFYMNTCYTGNAASLAKQLTVNAVDYFDQDNKITQYYEYDADGNPLDYSGNVAGTTAVFGMEALPFITEVYTQRSYKLVVNSESNAPGNSGSHRNNGNNGNGNGSNGNGNGNNSTPVSVTAYADENYTPGFAVEIRNPYENDIPLTDIYLWIGKGNTGHEESLDTLAGSALPNRMLGHDQILVLYVNSSDNSGISSSSHNLSNQISNGSNVVKVPLSINALKTILFVNSKSDMDSTFSVQLRATRQDDTKLAWGYSKVPIKQYVRNPGSFLLDDVDEDADTNLLDHYEEADLNNKLQFSQSSTFAAPAGLNALAYDFYNDPVKNYERDLESIDYEFNEALVYLTSLDRLGLNDKSQTQWEFLWYRDYSGVPWVAIHEGFSTSTTYFGTTTVTSKFDPTKDKWTFSNAGTINHVGDLLLVPIVGMQSDTTFATSLASSTATDELRADYMLDVFNTNKITADTSNVYYGMNFAQALLEQFVIRSPELDGADNDGDGLIDNQDTDELLIPGKINLNTATTRMLNHILPVSSISKRSNVVNAIASLRGVPTDTNPGIPTLSDLYGMNTASWTNSSSTYAQTTEIQRQLGSVASTRSDIYTAYVLIRGYRSSDFRKGAVESKQYFVIFDRSKISNSNGRVQILGYYEFD